MADSSLQLIYDVNSPTQSGLLDSFLSTIPAILPEFVRGDKTLSITVRPVRASGNDALPWTDDHLTGDTYRVGIGLPDVPATGGTFSLEIDGVSTGMSALAYDVSASALQSVLSAASVAGGNPAVTVTNPSSGVYVVTGTTNGALPLITGSATNLTPNSDLIISQIAAGSGSAKGQQIISIRQQLVALSTPSTALPAAGVTLTYDQPASLDQNAIARISFDADGTYGGLYSITANTSGTIAACGNAGPLISTQELGLILANNPAIHFQSSTDPDNVIISQDGADYLVEFADDLAGVALCKTINAATVAASTEITTSAAHGYVTGRVVTITNSTGTTPSLNGTYTITVTSSTKFTIPLNVTVSSSATGYTFDNSALGVSDVSLLAPKGVTGTIDLNTFNLASAFWAAADDSLTYSLSIERTRASGEIRTGLLVDSILKRDIIDVTSLVPVQFPAALNANTGVNFYADITDYAGGTSADLDSISTVSLDCPLCAVYRDPLLGAQMYVLLDDTSDANDYPSIVRPVDFNGTTNKKAWYKIL